MRSVSWEALPEVSEQERLREREEDAALVRGLQQSQPELAARFYDRFRPVVIRTLRRMLRSSEEHDELLQKTMVEAMLSIHRFKGNAPLEAWVVGIASNICLKHLRSRRSEQRWIEPGAEAESAACELPAPHSPAELAEYRSLIRLVQELLAKVDEKKASVFVLHEVMGHSLSEIAAIQGISESNAQTRLVRARRELHRLVEGQPELVELLRSWGGAS